MFGCSESMTPGQWHLPKRAVESGLRRLLRMAELSRDALELALGDALSSTLLLTTAAPPPKRREGRIHVVPSEERTVRLGVLDSTVPNVLEVESGDVVVYPDTWTHFLNRLQP